MENPNGGDLDNLSNLLINSYEDDSAALDAYELELERNLQDNLLLDKERHNQRLFQSFQKSACNVAQMFKDKPKQGQNAMSSWESFQNAAGAITVLYKESLEACRVHMELGVHLGQQKKLKDIISWIKKKKKRSIRKEELVSFLIGKQYPTQNQMFGNPFKSIAHRGGNTLVSSNASCATSSAAANTVQQQPNANPQLNLIGDNSNGSSEVETNSDLATFREALIMHNRSRDVPTIPSLSIHHPPTHHNHHHHHPTNNTNNNATPNETNCDDLDCFFCTQIATHIEHRKRANFDLDSPTRKRGRFH